MAVIQSLATTDRTSPNVFTYAYVAALAEVANPESTKVNAISADPAKRRVIVRADVYVFVIIFILGLVMRMCVGY